jgi:hypothetical protein
MEKVKLRRSLMIWGPALGLLDIEAVVSGGKDGRLREVDSVGEGGMMEIEGVRCDWVGVSRKMAMRNGRRRIG